MDKIKSIEVAASILDAANVSPEDYYIHFNGSLENSKEEQLITRSEAAKMMRISLPTLTRLTNEKKIQRIIISPRNIRYSRENIESFLRDQGE